MSTLPDEPMRVLIADACADTTDSLAALLILWGHEVRTAHDGHGTLELARAFRPDAVLMDIGLRGRMDGCQVARELRAGSDRTRVLLVCITGYDRPSDRDRVRAAGFDRYLIKPAAVEEVQMLLEGAKALRFGGGPARGTAGMGPARSHPRSRPGVRPRGPSGTRGTACDELTEGRPKLGVAGLVASSRCAAILEIHPEGIKPGFHYSLHRPRWLPRRLEVYPN